MGRGNSPCWGRPENRERAGGSRGGADLGVADLAAEVERACAAPGSCTPAAADLIYHPLRQDVEALAKKAEACPAGPAPAPAP